MLTPTSTRPQWPAILGFFALITGFGGALVGALVIGGVSAGFGASLDDPPPAVTILSTVVQDLCLIGAAILFARTVLPAAPWQFGLRPTRWKAAVGWVVLAYVGFIAFSAAYSSLLSITAEDELPAELGVDGSTVALVVVAWLVCVLAPLAEEFFFRGFLFPAVRNWKGLWPALLVNGIVFGGIHAGSAPAAFLVPLGLFGVVLCLLYVKTGSLWPSIVLHAINNSIAFGVSQDWDWQIPILMALALATIALTARIVRARFGPAPMHLSPV